MIKRFISAIVITFLAFTAATAQVVPAPVSFVAADGAFAIPPTLTVGASSKADARLVAKYLSLTGFSARAGSVAAAHVAVSRDTSLRPEQYKLDVTPQKITLCAADDAGLWYGVQSLAQLAEPSAGKSVAACSINDYPRFGYRGFMLDLVRCYIEPAEIKKFIDMAGRLKLNNVHLHLTDDNGWRLQIKKYPKLTEVGAWRVDRDDLFPGRLNPRSADEAATYGGFYTAAQMRDIVRYASERNINIIPEIEMPAHAAAAIASYPELACPVVNKFVGVFPGIGGKDASIILCGGNDKVYTFLQDVLDEVLDIFPSKRIHLGGDEANKAYWEKCPLCQQRIACEHLDGCEGLQAYLMDRIIAYVHSKGREAIGWDEVTYGNPKEEITIMGWQGDGGVAVNDSRTSGRKFILTPAKVLYLIRYQGPQWFEPWTYFGNCTLKDVYEYEPIQPDWTDAMKSNLLGLQASLWCEFCRTPQQMQYQVYPRLVALADAAWRPQGSGNWAAFLRTLDSAVLPVLNRKDMVCARSMYNLDHTVRPDREGGLSVWASCIRPDVEVRYCAGDSSFASSLPLTEPFKVSEPTTIYASTFRDGVQVGRTLALPLQFNKATGREVKSATCRNLLHPTLTNGLRASDRNSDFEWAGWWNDTADFIVDLGEVTDISSIRLGTLIHADICVAAPRTFYVYASEKGTSFELINKVDVADELIFHPKARVEDIVLGTFAHAPVKARYVKVVAVNPGCVPDGLAREGSPTWIYFDEIAIN